MPLIEFQQVSKIYSRQSREFFWRFLLEVFGKRKKEPLYALREVSFRVETGQCVGVIGPNGAGKSTLLNLVAGITVPEQGRVRAEGRIAALLELGSGFHPDLNGRENVSVNAALLGLSRREVERAYESIVDFAGLRDFIEEPLRTYSQGMILRLAFAIAVNVSPDILLIDEVLAVGDSDFQRKCQRKLLEMRSEGRILLCVSHMLEVLPKLCETALWIEGGRLVMNGPIEEVIAAYKASQASGAGPLVKR